MSYAFNESSVHATPKLAQGQCLEHLAAFWANPDDERYQGQGLGFGNAEVEIGTYAKCVVSVPCGGGKTDIAVRTIFAHPKGDKVRALILTSAGSGVKQCTELLKTHTNVPHTKIKDYGEETDKNRAAVAYLDEGVIVVSTYQTVSMKGAVSITKTLESTPFDVVIFDECHSLVSMNKAESDAQGATWRKHVSALRNSIAVKRAEMQVDEGGAQPLRVLSLTGTLARTLSHMQERKCKQVFGAESTTGEFRSTLFQAAFSVDIGPPVFRVSWKDMEARKEIAQLHLARIDCAPQDPLFSSAAAFAAAQPRCNKSIGHHLGTWNSRISPPKFRALDAIVASHKCLGHMGIIFVQHIDVLRAVYRHLNESGSSGSSSRWVVIRGDAQTDEQHEWKTLDNVFVTDAERHKIVTEFNQVDANVHYDGIIATSVCNGAMDIYNPDFCYAVQFERDGGAPACAQSVGRVARPHPNPEITKHSYIYDLVGETHAEIEAFEDRNAVLRRDEGYIFTTNALPEFLRTSAAELAEFVSGEAVDDADVPSASASASGATANLELLVRNLAIAHSGTVRATLVGALKSKQKRQREHAQELDKVDKLRIQSSSAGRGVLAARRLKQRKASLGKTKLEVKSARDESATLTALSAAQVCFLLDFADSGAADAPTAASVLDAMRAALTPSWPPPEVQDADAARALLPADDPEDGVVWCTSGDTFAAPEKRASTASSKKKAKVVA